MANYSTAYIQLSSVSEHDVKYGIELIKKYESDGELIITNSGEIEIIDKNGLYVVYIEAEAKYHMPDALYDGEVFEKYRLSGFIEDSEPSSDFFYRAAYKKGELMNKEDTEYFSPASIKAWGVDYWTKHYEEDFLKKGWDQCKDIRKVFNQAGYPDSMLKLWYYHEDVNVMISVVGENGTGKTTLADGLHNKHGFSIIKTDTTRPPRKTNKDGYIHEEYLFRVTNLLEAKSLIQGINWENFYDDDKETYLSMESVMYNKAEWVRSMPRGDDERELHLQDLISFSELMGDHNLAKQLKKDDETTQWTDIVSHFSALVDADQYIPFNENQWYNFKKEIDPKEMVEFAEFGGYVYGTSKQEMDFNAKMNKRFVKVIEPQGLAAIQEHIKDDPNTFMATIHMDIDKQTVFNNLKKEGLSFSEIEKRIERGTITEDMKKYDIKPDTVIKVLNNFTLDIAAAGAGNVLVRQIETAKVEKYNLALDFIQEGKINRPYEERSGIFDTIKKELQSMYGVMNGKVTNYLFRGNDTIALNVIENRFNGEGIEKVEVIKYIEPMKLYEYIADKARAMGLDLDQKHSPEMIEVKKLERILTYIDNGKWTFGEEKALNVDNAILNELNDMYETKKVSSFRFNENENAIKISFATSSPFGEADSIDVEEFKKHIEAKLGEIKKANFKLEDIEMPQDNKKHPEIVLAP